MIARRAIVVIENDEIGDEVWFPLIVKTLREYADYQEATKGCGHFPQCFKSSNGNKFTVYAGTYLRENLLDGANLSSEIHGLREEEPIEYMLPVLFILSIIY